MVRESERKEDRQAGYRIRAGSLADLEAVLAIYNEYVHGSPVTMDLQPQTLVAASDGWGQRFRVCGEGPYRLFIAERGGRVLGYCRTVPFASRAGYAGSVETSVYCHPCFTGQGMGTALQRASLEAMARVGVHRVYACVTLPNEASVRMFRRLRFRKVGVMREAGYKFGRWWDVMWLEKNPGSRPRS